MLSQTEKELKDLRLDARLPKLEYVDMKAGKRNNHAELIVLTRYEVETVMAFEYHTVRRRKGEDDCYIPSSKWTNMSELVILPITQWQREVKKKKQINVGEWKIGRISN